jgi:hypothetical protein
VILLALLPTHEPVPTTTSALDPGQLGRRPQAARRGGRRLPGGAVMVAGRSVKGWQVCSVALLTVALAVAGRCGGRARSASSSTAALPSPATTSGSGARDVKAIVSGRAVVGQCVGRKTGAPTVVLEVEMGTPRDSLLVVEDHLRTRTQVCSYDRAGKGDSDPASRPRPVTEVVSDLHAFLRRDFRPRGPRVWRACSWCPRSPATSPPGAAHLAGPTPPGGGRRTRQRWPIA